MLCGMPSAPRSRRVRRYDPRAVRTALDAEVQMVRTLLAGLAPATLEEGTRLPGWRVRDLAAHLAVCLDSPGRLLAETDPRTTVDLDLPGYVRSLAAQRDDIADAAIRKSAAWADPSGETLRERLGTAARNLAATVSDTPGDRPVATRFGTLTLDAFLVTRLLEVLVHADDLAAASSAASSLCGPPAPAEPSHHRDALATVSRLLADALAAAAPGASVELRVPPFVAVQCVAGPRHTRGTPQNIVETGPLTWIRLATGRLDWSDAVAERLLFASGERADLSTVLPVCG